jgi:hypothetical protein
MSAAPSQPTRRLPGPLRFARMAGCSIATPAAAGWVTDFLNAAYHARPEAQRDPADLRLAYGVLTTRWANLPDRRLGAGDVVALHRAYARLRLRGRGRLDRESLLIGASTLIGDWFEDAWADERRRAHGIAFPTSTARDAFTPERRLRHAALGPLTPPTMTPDKQHWATYDSVALPDPEAALRLLGQPARWPDIASAAGRFTALRPGGLLGQTFEIEVIAKPAPRSPVFTRGYVTCTTAHIPTAESGQADLQNAVAELNDRYQAGASASARPILPSDAQPLGAGHPHHPRRSFPRPRALAPACVARRAWSVDPRRRRLGPSRPPSRRRLPARRPRCPADVLGTHPTPAQHARPASRGQLDERLG